MSWLQARLDGVTSKKSLGTGNLGFSKTTHDVMDCCEVLDQATFGVISRLSELNPSQLTWCSINLAYLGVRRKDWHLPL